MQLVRDAVELAGHAVVRDPAQLGGQLVGRLPIDTGDFVEPSEQPGARSRLVPVHATLASPGGALVATMAGHRRPVTAVCVSRDGRYAFSGSEDQTIRQWDLSTRSERATYAFERTPTALAIGLGGELLLWGADDGTLSVWDVTRQGEVRRIATGSGGIFSVGWVGMELAVSGGEDRMLRVWDLDSGTQLHELDGRSPAVMLPDGRSAVSYHPSGLLSVWDLVDGTELRRLAGDPEPVIDLAVSPDGRTLVSMAQGFDGSAGLQVLKVWDIERGQQSDVELDLGPVGGAFQPGIGSVSIDGTGGYAVSGSITGVVYVWEWRNGVQPAPLRGHTGQVRATAASPAAPLAITGGLDHAVRVWALDRPTSGHQVTGHDGEVGSVAFGADAGVAISCATDGILLWDPGSGDNQPLATDERAWSATIAAGGRLAAVGTHAGPVQVWDLETLRHVGDLGEGSSPVMLVSTDPDDSVLALALDGSWRRWDIERGIALEEHPPTKGASPMFGLGMAPDGSIGLAGNMDGSVRLWRPRDHEVTDRLGVHADRISSIAVSTDGSLGATGSADGRLKVWDLATGEPRGDLAGHQATVMRIAFAPDGRTLITVANDHTLRAWDLTTGANVATFTGESGILACAVSSDGSLIGAGEYGGRVHFLRLVHGTAAVESGGYVVAVSPPPVACRPKKRADTAASESAPKPPDAADSDIRHVEEVSRLAARFNRFVEELTGGIGSVEQFQSLQDEMKEISEEADRLSAAASREDLKEVLAGVRKALGRRRSEFDVAAAEIRDAELITDLVTEFAAIRDQPDLSPPTAVRRLESFRHRLEGAQSLIKTDSGTASLQELMEAVDEHAWRLGEAETVEPLIDEFNAIMASAHGGITSIGQAEEIATDLRRLETRVKRAATGLRGDDSKEAVRQLRDAVGKRRAEVDTVVREAKQSRATVQRVNALTEEFQRIREGVKGGISSFDQGRAVAIELQELSDALMRAVVEIDDDDAQAALRQLVTTVGRDLEQLSGFLPPPDPPPVVITKKKTRREKRADKKRAAAPSSTRQAKRLVSEFEGLMAEARGGISDMKQLEHFVGGILDVQRRAKEGQKEAKDRETKRMLGRLLNAIDEVLTQLSKR